MVGVLTRATLRGTLGQVRHVSPVRPAQATGLVAQVYHQVDRDFGMLAPPVSLHSPAELPLAASWLILRETLLATGRADRAMKETVAAAVSLGNACPYCVDVHTTALHGLLPASVGRSIAADRVGSVDDPELRAVAAWARASGTAAGVLGAVPGVPATLAPELIGVAVTFHYLNRMVNVFLDTSPIPTVVPGPWRDTLRHTVGRLMSRIVTRPHPPGISLPLLPPAPAAADLDWANGSRHVADAFARAARAVEDAAEHAVPPPVRALLTDRLTSWAGGSDGAAPEEVDAAVAVLAPGDRAAGRLAWLTAFAAIQVSPELLGQFRRHDPRDSTLIELTSWASLAAARRVGTWLWAGWPDRSVS